jgi:4-hydroxyproline epimerase
VTDVATLTRIRIVDTHTGGEPTRVVVAGGPDLGSGTMLERRERFARQFDGYRKAIVCEPRGSDVMVGALLTPPERSDSLCGVIFFNNVGYLGMCGHGTLGVAVALAHLGQAAAGRHRLDTPAGQVSFELCDNGSVTIENVPSYRYRAAVPVALPSGRTVHGDIAYGGNWFYICGDHGLDVHGGNLTALHELACAIRRELDRQSITGEAGAEIDHVELVGQPLQGEPADARNFVLCPGAAYDRSPCGTGTSAKVACLAAEGKLAAGETWRQASVIGSLFHASYHSQGQRVIVRLNGTAFVNAEADLILDPRDPFCMGIG